jgi:hypothetical protein
MPGIAQSAITASTPATCQTRSRRPMARLSSIRLVSAIQAIETRSV